MYMIFLMNFWVIQSYGPGWASTEVTSRDEGPDYLSTIPPV